jgi:hypothetical protein
MDVQGKIMMQFLERAARWLFLGHGMQSVIVNMASIFGSLYLVLFIVIISLNFPEGYPYALVVCEYICAVVYITAFIVSHTKREEKYFDYVKTAVALNSMLICGFLYATPDGKIWSFLVPFFIVLISQHRLGLFFCLAYFFYMIFIEIFFEPREMWVILRYYLTFLLQVALVCTYEVLRISYENKLFKEKEFTRGLLAHYNEMKELYETLSILHHDLKYHLKITDELLQSGKVQEAGQYLTDIKSQIPEDNMHYCLNHAVNALLSSYAKRCRELDIKYDTDVAIPEMLSMPDYDICTILGNLLENALEARQKLENGREIELNAKIEDSRLAILVKNRFDGAVSEKKGKLASTKKRGGGLGLPGIQAVLDSHDGYMLTEWDKDEFTAYVIVNIVVGANT